MQSDRKSRTAEIGCQLSFRKILTFENLLENISFRKFNTKTSATTTTAITTTLIITTTFPATTNVLPVSPLQTRANPQKCHSNLRMISRGYRRNRATITPRPTIDAIRANVTNSWTTINQPRLISNCFKVHFSFVFIMHS